MSVEMERLRDLRNVMIMMWTIMMDVTLNVRLRLRLHVLRNHLFVSSVEILLEILGKNVMMGIKILMMDVHLNAN